MRFDLYPQRSVARTALLPPWSFRCLGIHEHPHNVQASTCVNVTTTTAIGKAQIRTSCASVDNVMQSPLAQETMLSEVKADIRIWKQQWLVPKYSDSVFSLARGHSCVLDMTPCIGTLYPGNFTPIH